MELYQAVLDRLDALVSSHPERKEYPYDESRRWPETERFELVMGRDAAYELGASGKGAANYTCVTTEEGRWSESRTIVIGRDLNEIKADSPYARLVQYIAPPQSASFSLKTQFFAQISYTAPP